MFLQISCDFYRGICFLTELCKFYICMLAMYPWSGTYFINFFEVCSLVFCLVFFFFFFFSILQEESVSFDGL